jgi:hypothetical protein
LGCDVVGHRLVRADLGLAGRQPVVEVLDAEYVYSGPGRDGLLYLAGPGAGQADGGHRDRQRNLQVRILALQDLDRLGALVLVGGVA